MGGGVRVGRSGRGWVMVNVNEKLKNLSVCENAKKNRGRGGGVNVNKELKFL